MEELMEKRTKAETEDFYRELLADLQQSGQTLRAFAEEHGIPAGTLSAWRSQLRRRDAARQKAKRDAERRQRSKRPAERKASFVPVNVKEKLVGVAASESSVAGGYELALGAGRVLRLPADFDPARVAALVRAVASC